MFLTENVLGAPLKDTKYVSGGQRTTLDCGESVTFTNLPLQPVAIISYNNTGHSTPVVTVYNNQMPNRTQLDSIHAQGFSLGSAYLINPAKTQGREITVSVPSDAHQGASVDVYAVSLSLPLSEINNQNIPLTDEAITFHGYSRSYAVPPSAWFEKTIKAQGTGQVGLSFIRNEIHIIGVNIAVETHPALKRKIIVQVNSGIEYSDITYHLNSGNIYQETFYGTSDQLVYSPISAKNIKNNGYISLRKIS